MNDSQTTLKEIKDIIKEFIKQRDWQQFHSPKNLSMAIAAEAAELMEKFLWIESSASFQELEHNRKEVEDEVADILWMLLCLCNASSIDLTAALEQKMVENARKYPIAKAKGNYLKYDKL